MDKLLQDQTSSPLCMLPHPSSITLSWFSFAKTTLAVGQVSRELELLVGKSSLLFEFNLGLCFFLFRSLIRNCWNNSYKRGDHKKGFVHINCLLESPTQFWRCFCRFMIRNWSWDSWYQFVLLFVHTFDFRLRRWILCLIFREKSLGTSMYNFKK